MNFRQQVWSSSIGVLTSVALQTPRGSEPPKFGASFWGPPHWHSRGSVRRVPPYSAGHCPRLDWHHKPIPEKERSNGGPVCHHPNPAEIVSGAASTSMFTWPKNMSWGSMPDSMPCSQIKCVLVKDATCSEVLAWKSLSLPSKLL